MKRLYVSARVRLGLALAASSLVSVGLFAGGALKSHNGALGYLAWNLLLAWLALLAALWLERTLHRSLWSSWYALALTLVWLAFLPNTFYMITDFIHVHEVTQPDLVYNVVVFSSFIFNGVILGYLSLFVVHWELAKRLKARSAFLLIELVILICSFAIYVGRELRWNTWDLVTNPLSVLLDVSDRVINPHKHPQAFAITFSFFVLLSSVYVILWYVARTARSQRTS